MKYLLSCIFSVLVVNSATAVNINPGGYGETVILPYYTVNNGLNTLLTVNNSTDQAKAIKVHFREGKEGKAVLSFNMFLAPQDVWVAGLVPNSSTIPGHVGEDSSMLLFADLSCTPFLESSQEFLPYEIDDESEDTNLKRATEGYIEIIEMGELDPSIGLGNAVTFDVDGIPNACEEIEEAYLDNGTWNETDGDLTAELLPVKGGISASVGIIDVAEGTLYSYDGVAFENFYPANSIFHTTPGDTRAPSLEQADTTSVVVNDGDVISTDWEFGYQAISALLMKNQIESFYSTYASIAAKTEMTLSFPTKRFYATDESPFAESSGSEFSGCANYEVTVLDRESKNQCAYSLYNCVANKNESPRPPDPELLMCNSINVLQVVDSNNGPTELPSGILGAEHFRYRNIGVAETGKLYVKFNQSVASPSNTSYLGVPVLALAFEKYTNASAAPGLLAQYGGIFIPKYKSHIVNN